MKQRTNPDIDIILDILLAMRQAHPGSVFINSLHQQYCERGSLSKKQLEGLYSKSSKEKGIHPGKLATLQAIIMKKPTKYRSAIPTENMIFKNNDPKYIKMILQVLTKYPGHKRVLYFKAKYDNNEILSVLEIGELERFCKI